MSLGGVFRHLGAILVAGLVGHALLIAAVLGFDLGGPYSVFAATSIEFAVLSALLINVAPDGLAQATALAFGPFFAPVLLSTAILALVCMIARQGRFLFQLFTSALIGVVPLAVRLREVSPGAPVVEIDDLALVAAVSAIAGALYWLLGGRRIKRRQAASSG